MICELDQEALEELEVQLYSQIYHPDANTDNSPTELAETGGESSTAKKPDDVDEPDGFNPQNAVTHKQLNKQRYYNNSVIEEIKRSELGQDIAQAKTPERIQPLNTSSLESEEGGAKKQSSKKKRKRRSKGARVIDSIRENFNNSFGGPLFNPNYVTSTPNCNFRKNFCQSADPTVQSTKETIICISDDESTTNICLISDDEDDEETVKLPTICDDSKKEEFPNDNSKANTMLKTTLKLDDHFKADSDNEDVIFVEPKPVEIIDIDVDLSETVVILQSKTVADADASVQEQVNSSTSNSTISLPSSKESNSTPTKDSEGRTSKNKSLNLSERTEILSTPDSAASNDFIDNSLVSERDKFNFDLHGSDFGSFAKPKPHNEIYETESSCSATDCGTPSKAPLFAEAEFESPTKVLFAEDNLESFGEFIVPRRKTVSPAVENENSFVVESEKDVADTPNKNSSGVSRDSSDSSSESEYGDASSSTKEYPKKKRNRLPSLSAISPNTSTTSSKKKGKKKRKNKEASDDVSSSNNEGEPGKTNKKRKDKLSDSEGSKQKKHKANAEDDVQNKKKRKSEDEEELAPKKKRSKRKQDDFIVQEDMDILTLDTEISFEVEKPEENEAQPVDEEAQDFDVRIIEQVIPSVVVSDDEDEEEVQTDLAFANCSVMEKEQLPPFDPAAETEKKRKNFSDYYTPDRNKFYNCSWGLENFSVTESQKTMSDDPNLWKIIDRDRNKIRLPGPRGGRCHRCRERGHLAIDCPNKIGPPVCKLCGKKGHLEMKCPNKLCSNCGRKGEYSTVYCKYCISDRNVRCRICRTFGHTPNRCPDLWRRYAFTTKEGPINEVHVPRKPPSECWCSGCGKNGHLEFECRTFNRTYPKVDPTIRSFEDPFSPNFDPFRESNFSKPRDMPPPQPQPPIQPVPQQIQQQLLALHQQQQLQQHQLQQQQQHQQISNVISNVAMNIRNQLMHNSVSINSMPSFIPLNMNAGNYEFNLLNNRSVSRDLNIQFRNDNKNNTSVREEELGQNENQLIYYLALEPAEFLQKDEPGRDFLRDLKRDLRIRIEIVRNLEVSTCYASIIGSAERINMAREIIDIYVQSEMPNYRVPAISKLALGFLQVNIAKCNHNYNPTDVLRNIYELESNIRACGNFKFLPGMRYKLRDLYNCLNVSLLGTYKIENSEKCMETLLKAKSTFEQANCYNLSNIDRDNIQNAFNYIFYTRRPLKDYEKFIRILENNKPGRLVFDLRNVLEKPKSHPENKPKTTPQKGLDEISDLDRKIETMKQNFKHFERVRKSQYVPIHFNDSLPKFYEEFLRGREPVWYKKFRNVYNEFNLYLKKVKAMKT